MLDDFKNIYSSLRNEGKIYNLPSKSASLSEWSDSIYNLANNPRILKQADYWNQIENKKLKIPFDFHNKDFRTINVDFASIEIGKEKTEYLIKYLYKTHNVTMEEFLLLVVTRSLKSWLQQNEIIIYLEGHGRDSEELDLSRTIGWFTNIYPVIIDLEDENIENQIKNINLSLTTVPDKGVGYGLLKYIHNEMHSKNKISGVRFNYLGQYSDENNNDLFKYIVDSSFSDISEENDLTTHIEIDSLIVNNKLKIIVKFNKISFLNSTIENFKKEIESNINEIYRFLAGTNEKYFTTSHFETIELEEDDLDSLFE